METITTRIDRVTGLTREYRRPDPPAPRSLKIEISARCDFKCFFCATGFKLRKKADIDRGLYERVVREARQAGVEELGVFYLGESFLCEWLPEAVAYAKRDCGFPYVFLTTNGRTATPDRVRACMEAGLDSLKFSFNWANEAQFQSVTGVAGRAYHDVVKHVKAAHAVRGDVEARTGHRCGLYASSIEYDGEQLVQMREAVAGIRPFVDEHYWLPLYGQAGLTAGARGTKPTPGNQGRVGALRPPLPCWSLFTEAHVTYDGKLAACCFDHDGRFDMGDLREKSFAEAWHSAKFQALREAHLRQDVAQTACERCLVCE